MAPSETPPRVAHLHVEYDRTARGRPDRQIYWRRGQILEACSEYQVHAGAQDHHQQRAGHGDTPDIGAPCT